MPGYQFVSLPQQQPQHQYATAATTTTHQPMNRIDFLNTRYGYQANYNKLKSESCVTIGDEINPQQEKTSSTTTTCATEFQVNSNNRIRRQLSNLTGAKVNRYQSFSHAAQKHEQQSHQQPAYFQPPFIHKDKRAKNAYSLIY